MAQHPTCAPFNLQLCSVLCSLLPLPTPVVLLSVLLPESSALRNVVSQIIFHVFAAGSSQSSLFLDYFSAVVDATSIFSSVMFSPCCPDYTGMRTSFQSNMFDFFSCISSK